MFKPLRRMLATDETRVIAISALTIIAIGTAFYTWAEGWTPIQALYFCVVTLATVGYGDLHPTTELSQLFTIGYILAGIGIIAAFATELAKLRGSAAPVEKEAIAVEQKVVQIVESVEDDVR